MEPTPHTDLRASQARHQLLSCLLDYIPDRIYFKDKDGAFILVSRSEAEYLGAVNPGEVIGKTDFDFFEAPLAQASLDDERSLMQTGDSVTGKEEKKLLLDGRTGWALVDKIPLRDAEGAIIGTCGISKDITRLKEAEEALQRANDTLAAQKAELECTMALREQAERELLAAKHEAEEASKGLGPFFQVALDMLCIAGMDGYFKRINPAFCSTLGYSEEELLLKPFTEFVHPEDQAKTAAVMVDLGSGKNVVNFVNRYQHHDGHYLWIEWTAAPNSDGSEIYAAARNITSRIQIEAELTEARQAAEAANRAKSSFLANMSHEIRTPMNGVIGVTELLLNTEMTADQRGYLSLVRQSADSLMTVLNDILDFSKIEAGKMELERYEFDLRDSIGDTLQSLAVRSAEKGIELAYQVRADVPDCLVGDLTRLRQIIINLVGNAIKFTAQGEIVVEIEVETLTKDQVVLHVAVRDTGIGIAKEKQEDVFESFTQAEGSTTRRFGGSGLGLTISRQLAELMKGRLWLESEPGTGSVFHFTALFNLGSPKPAPARQMPETLNDLPVLIVDDNSTNRTILEQQVRSWGMKPTLAASGPDALQIMEDARNASTPFKLLLMDYMMPDMDGIEVARQAYQRLGEQAPKILILSSGNKVEENTNSAEVGIERFLTKPVKPSDLFDAITRVFGSATNEDKSVISKDAPASLSPGRMNLLLVEDGRVNQIVAMKLLEDRGHKVTLATNGREAVDILATTSFDAILMDIQMPEMNGYEATTIIRQRELSSGKHVPIIAMTANAMKGDREQCLAAGMDDYISKPVHSVHLYAIIEKYADLHPLRESATDVAPQPQEPQADAAASFDAEAFRTSIGDDALMRELIAVFFEDAPRLMTDARLALTRRNAEALHHAAHSLKGMVGNYSATPAFRAVSLLTDSTRAGKLKKAGSLLAVAEKEMTRLTVALEEFLKHL
jgi:PAS domain S-box-containing protein